MPNHVAIIMDGNGRWATRRSLPRLMGHKAGVDAVERTVMAAKAMGDIKYLSLYAFSTENWKRPDQEIKGLMGLIRFYLFKKAKQMKKENIRLRFAGRRSGLAKDVISIIEASEAITADCSGLQLVICLNYGGRQEIIDAVNKLLESGHIDRITVEQLEDNLYLPDIPDPDLIIRTSGELRLSNFWLWQCTYSEFYFTKVLWPDFGADELKKAVDAYLNRERRYGSFQP